MKFYLIKISNKLQQNVIFSFSLKRYLMLKFQKTQRNDKL